MRINQNCKVREIAGENVVIMQGRNGADLTQIITLNESALILWQALSGSDFEVEDAQRVLTENFEVDDATALRDAQQWVERMRECKLIE
ncbi:MAG: PqqD family protein [Alistipes sp.]|nr:PqqD family protein [Alistipes sp.]MBQ5899406.1 PqqD family protein [Alistipes sp.]